MAFVSIDQGDQVTLATETGDDGTLADKTACLTDDSSATSCIEIKAGVGCRVEINIAPASIDQTGDQTIRIGVESIMTAGTLRIAPYSDANTIVNTNGVTTTSISAGGDVDTVVSDAFLDDLGDLGGKCAIRIFENASGGKIKTGEVDHDFLELGYAISPLPVFTDDGGTVINAGEYQVFKVSSTNPMVLAETPRETGTTNASGQIAGLELPVGDWCILWRDHNATEASAAVDMSHIFTVTAP